VRNEVREVGGIRRLSVAVALNAGASPRDPAELQRIASLVQAAVGYNPGRGDQINVVEAAFSPATAAEPKNAGTAAAAPPASDDGDSILRFGEMAAFAAVIIALVMFVLRPLLSAPKAAATAPASIGAPARAAALPAPAGDAASAATSLRRAADIVKSNTDESAGILKVWIRKAS
jgi:flagellar M-ring protein FliF